MRKQNICFRAGIAIFFSAGLFLSAHAQRPTRTPITAEQAKEFENSKEAKEVTFTAAEKQEGREKAQALAAYLIKAVMHRIDPKTYPIDDDANSMEQIALKAVDKMAPSTLARAKTKFPAFLGDAPRREKKLGKFKDIDFKKKSITPDIKKVTRLQLRPVTQGSEDGTSHYVSPEVQTAGVGGAIADDGKTAPAYNYMDWILRAVHCVDETNPESGDDDIVVGGLLVGASMNTKSANTIISCKFNDGGYCNHGSYPFGYVSLNTTNSFPKTFYLILQLVEVDSDEREVAAALTDAMNTVGSLAGGGYQAAIAAVAALVNIFVAIIFDDDIFPERAIEMTLGGENTFGSDGRSDNWHTRNIYGHGGAYRVGFYNRLR